MIFNHTAGKNPGRSFTDILFFVFFSEMFRCLQMISGIPLTIILLAGCHGKEYQEKKKAWEEREAAKKHIHKESEEIWKESTAQKDSREGGSGGGNLMIGNKTLVLTELSLFLGSLKVSGDMAAGQEPSELKGSSSKGPALIIKALPLEAATRAAEVMGKTLTITTETSANTEITSEDGTKWRLQDASISFHRSERSMVFLTMEGRAVNANGQNSETVNVTAELQARVLDSKGKPTSEE